ncbi:MAG TPA: thiamine pyrophosphate-binding protein [Candidatus Lustribacter sp.]|nr:thiamine pyrophosphate-binding protein [Candidatus Lustribacter sp.]
MKRPGGRVLVDALALNGTDTIFCVPGESYLAVLDALYDRRDDIRVITCRQEGGATFMAEAYGKLTGRPGVAFVTRGPGATNASIGVHTAFQDSTPLLLFIGQVDRDALGREAFQEVDFRAMFAPLAKAVIEIERGSRIPEILSRAFALAMSGRPGPVVISLPEDVLSEEIDIADAPAAPAAQAGADAAQMALLADHLRGAQRPIVIAGGSRWDAASCAQLQLFAERNVLPVACAYRRQDLFDNRHPLYAGDASLGIVPDLVQRFHDADLILAIGTRLGDITTGGYSYFDVPRPQQRLVHVHPDAGELGRVYQPDLAINAGVRAFAAAAATIAVDGSHRHEWAAAANRAYVADRAAGRTVERVDLRAVVLDLSERLPTDAIVTVGAGNFTTWVHRYFQFKQFGTALGPTSGAMGYGVPAGIAAKLRHPERTVVTFAGDGDFLMTGQELATAVRYGVALVILIVNNGMYATIRMHQERNYPGRVSSTDLTNPDFAALARAYGAHGERVATTAEFAPAFERAVASGGPAVLELDVDPDAITSRTSITALRAR